MGDHPFGAYFTTLESDEPNLATKLRIPREKLRYVFRFKECEPTDLRFRAVARGSSSSHPKITQSKKPGNSAAARRTYDRR